MLPHTRVPTGPAPAHRTLQTGAPQQGQREGRLALREFHPSRLPQLPRALASGAADEARGKGSDRAGSVGPAAARVLEMQDVVARLGTPVVGVFELRLGVPGPRSSGLGGQGGRVSFPCFP